jgi:hypothetical protein
MLTIKDISASKELDRAAMTEVRGGDANQIVGISQGQVQNVAGGFLAVAEGNQSLYSSATNIEHKDLDVLQLALGTGNGNFF